MSPRTKKAMNVAMSPLGPLPVENAGKAIRGVKAAREPERAPMMLRDSRAMAVGWDEIFKAIGPECDPLIVKQMRRFYYAGAKRVMDVLLHHANLDECDEPTADDLSKVDALEAEINAFLNTVAAGMN